MRKTTETFMLISGFIYFATFITMFTLHETKVLDTVAVVLGPTFAAFFCTTFVLTVVFYKRMSRKEVLSIAFCICAFFLINPIVGLMCLYVRLLTKKRSEIVTALEEAVVEA